MSGFKDAGQFIPVSTNINPQVAESGGIDFEHLVAVKHPNFRLRKPDQMSTRTDLSLGDLTPIKTIPRSLSAITLPPPETARMGIEAEFHVIDTKGNPVSMYGADSVQKLKDGKETHFVIDHQNEPWAIDSVPGLTPEGLKFQAEIATSPETTFDTLHQRLKETLVPIAQAFQNKKWYLQPTGLLGLPLKPDISNISPHDYIFDIHTFGLKQSATDFDANTIQSHVDQSPFGASLEFSLIIGNAYNGVLATMINALSLSAPFWKGRANHSLSYRELARNRITTHGGVQDNIPVDAEAFLLRGHQRVSSGEIPVPERAGGGQSNGSHNDYRPKLSTGTGEHGSSDSNPNPELWVAQTLILRRFTEKVAESITHKENILPPFLVMDSFSTRKTNRRLAAKYGIDACIFTSAGQITIRQAWENFFAWAKPKYSSQDWDRSVDIINRSMAQSANRVEDFYNPNSPNYLHGSFAIAMMKTYGELPGSELDKIKQTNIQVATGFMGLINNL
jgi:hypothetical protein